MTADPGAYNLEATMGRVRKLLWVLAILGFWSFVIAKGWAWGASFLAGALLAIGGFRLTHRFVMSIGPGGVEKPRLWQSVLLGARYLLLGGLVWVMLRVFGLEGVGILCGLLTPAVAMIGETLRELLVGREG